MHSGLEEALAALPESGSLFGEERAAVGQSFARLESIFKSNGRMYGCWNSTFSGACEETKVTWFALGAVIDYQGAGVCDGKSIMAVTHM